LSEYLAIRKLNPDGKSPILCFVGPPGVGKTSLGQSIARATDRKFVRLSLRRRPRRSEIRGHRRTYNRRASGNIISSIHKAAPANPVMMLDEMDKLGAGFHGDPRQRCWKFSIPNKCHVRDQLSCRSLRSLKSLFIGTANVVDNIPTAVRDRMEK